MLTWYANGQGSVVIRFKIRNSSLTTNAGLTGLSSASSGLSISTIANNEATATTYTVAGSTIETITTLGTYAAPTSTKCRFKEVDATNMPGWYELHLADARFAVSGAKGLSVCVKGATNADQVDFVIPLTSLNPHDAVRAGLTALPNVAAGANGGLPIGVDASGRVDVLKINGTSQTARDLGASVLLSSGTGTGQISLTSGAVTVGTNNDKTGYSISGTKTTLDALNDITIAQVNTEVDTALADIRLDELLNADSDIDGASPPVVGSVFHELMTKTAGSFTYDQATDSLEAVRDRGDSAWITATGFSTHSASDVWGVATRTLTAGTNIDGSTFTAIPWNAAWDAEVESECNDALVAQNLDHLVKSAVDTNFATTVHLDSVIGQIADNGTTATFDRTTDSMESIRDRGDSAWITATGFSTLSQTDIRTAVGLASANLDTQLDALPTAAENATAHLTTQMTESYATDGVAPTVTQALMLIQQTLTEFAISGTSLAVKKLDGVTTAATMTLNDDTTPTSVTRSG